MVSAQLNTMKTPLTLLSGLLALSLHTATAQFVVTGTYDENLVNANTVESTAGSSNITLGAFQTLLTQSYAQDAGGVINFEGATLSAATAFTASYGANTLTVTRVGGATTWNTSAGLNTAQTDGISGNQYLAGSSGGNHQFSFDTPITAFGMTVLYRGADRTVTPTIFFEDSTSVTLTAFNVAGGSGTGSAAQTPDVFFGYYSPTNKITRVDLIGDGFIRMDDLGFSTIPEPSAYAVIAGALALGLVAYRRRR